MRTQRAGRLAACTAIVLSAGMLLAGPAAADGGAPHATPAPAPRAATAPPTLTLPRPAAADKDARKDVPKDARKAPRSAVANAPVKAKPRFDPDNDGYSDLLTRWLDDRLYLAVGNGKPNALFANNLGTYKDLINPGDLGGGSAPEVLDLSPTGTLTLHADVTTSSGVGPGSWSGGGWNMFNKVVSAGDVSGDGLPDLLARTPGGDLYLYTGTGSLSAPFTTGRKVGSGWDRYDQIVGANDANGDGLGDVYGRTPSGDLYFYAGTGNAADPLAAGVKVGYGWDGFNQIIGVDDQSGDGLGDLLARDTSGQAWFYAGNGDGTLKPHTAGGKGWQGSDFAGSGGNPAYGKNDLVGLDANGTLSSYYGRGNGELSAASAGPAGGWNGAHYIALASSLTASRWADLLEVTTDGELYVDGKDLGGGWGIYNSVIGVGDLTNEGNGDLLARQPGNGHLYLYPGNGEGSRVYSRVDIGGGWNAYDKLLGAGDVNGDGQADLLARTPGGDLYLYAGTGDPKTPFKGRVKIGYGWDMYSGGKIAAPGDLTGDGRTDLVAVDSSGNLWRYDADGTGGFKSRVKIGYGWNTYKYGIY
ncbi:FG-GAP repeat domain-containing protein [Streptomyces sp. NPDC048416]|uniref:FG-GAP repeat domain-containing protein n=1 Tax=Streptomyces sp. NPDC048416 TaxID=3365546 RepID=UPI0037138CB1